MDYYNFPQGTVQGSVAAHVEAVAQPEEAVDAVIDRLVRPLWEMLLQPQQSGSQGAPGAGRDDGSGVQVRGPGGSGGSARRAIHASKALAVAHIQVEDKTSILRSLFTDERLEHLLEAFRCTVDACCNGQGGNYGSHDVAVEVLKGMCVNTLFE